MSLICCDPSDRSDDYDFCSRPKSAQPPKDIFLDDYNQALAIPSAHQQDLPLLSLANLEICP